MMNFDFYKPGSKKNEKSWYSDPIFSQGTTLIYIYRPHGKNVEFLERNIGECTWDNT